MAADSIVIANSHSVGFLSSFTTRIFFELYFLIWDIIDTDTELKKAQE